MDFCCKDYDTIANRFGSTCSSVKYWEGQHRSSKNRLYVSNRADRHLLMSLYEQSRQIAQIRVDRFGDENEQNIKKACDMMTKLGKMYAEEQVSRAGLHTKRDELAVEFGAGPVKRVAKKPACKEQPGRAEQKKPRCRSRQVRGGGRGGEGGRGGGSGGGGEGRRRAGGGGVV